MINSIDIKKLIAKVTEALSKTLTLINTDGSADMNDYVVEGKYYFSGGVTLSNVPSGSNGWLEVLPTQGGIVKQIWHRQGSNPTTFRDTFIRLGQTGNWGNWERIVTESYMNAQLPNTVSSVEFENISVANTTDTNVGNTGSLAAGTYILVCTASFANNSTGRRVIYLANSASGSAMNRYSRITQSATTGAATQLQLTYPVTITSATTFYMGVYQASGGELNCTNLGIKIIRLR